MIKPLGKAEAGWYEHPEVDGYEKYWDGKSWSKYDRLVGEEGPIVFPANVKHLGEFLFRRPFGSDGAFIAYIIVSALSIISHLVQESKNNLNSFGQFAALTGSILIFIWVYIIFLIYLVPRRIVDKKRGLQKYIQESKINGDIKETGNKSKKVFAIVGVVVFLATFAFLGLKQVSKSDGDIWFEEEQRISAIMGEWNQGIAPFVTLIQEISSGQISIVEAQEKAAPLNSTAGRILIRLSDECSDVPNEPITGQGQERAFQLMWKMLRVACDVIPQQYTETLAIYKAQISATSTQEDIDYHVAQLAALGERKKSAAIEALDAMSPFATAGELENLKRMRALLEP